MKEKLKNRIIKEAERIVETKKTLRELACEFNVSKSTVHKDVSERLKEISPSLYEEVRKVLDENKAERHIRGGMATKLKYIKMNQCRERYKTE